MTEQKFFLLLAVFFAAFIWWAWSEGVKQGQVYEDCVHPRAVELMYDGSEERTAYKLAKQECGVP